MTKRGAWVALGLVGAIVVGGCARPPETTATAAYPTAERWCYRTLAEVDCYASPQQGAELRRVGWFDAVLVE